ncbi:hypothetical protein BJF80_02915 [Serinicoccus sp. CUA-874]|nr:hypothetical protein BJF80_02915 [Serinicoccus sp. CUA-874]
MLGALEGEGEGAVDDEEDALGVSRPRSTRMPPPAVTTQRERMPVTATSPTSARSRTGGRS